MPISSFYGMQTSLRGLLAQQRLLDTTGHNIANASTQGYSRQEATLAASAATPVQVSGSQASTGAFLGSGVDVQGFRRVRDQFLDAQYRGQNTNLSDWSARSSTLNNVELSLSEPGTNGINAKLSKFWDAWSTLTHAPNDLSAKQALVQTGAALTDSIQAVRDQMVTAQQSAQDQYAQITGPGGDIANAAAELAGLNKTISGFITAGDPPNDLMDRRDQLLDQLSGYGQLSIDSLSNGSMNVSFVDGSTGTKYSIVSGSTADWAGPPAGDWAPGGQLGGLLSAAKTPGGTIDGYLATLDSFSQSLADTVNTTYGASFFTTGTPAGATIQVDPALMAAPGSVTSGSGAAGSTDIALKVSQLRGTPAIDGVYQAFVTKVGGDLQNAQSMEANAQVLADASEDRRSSVSGISMDEEMSHLVQFQRAYQASARAMSTMDDMLDVLINRTGRVGL
jgi:flagellar hook-associated protein 1 FlgK